MFFYRNPLKWAQKQVLLAGPPDEDPTFNFLAAGIAMSADSNFLALGAMVDGLDFKGAAYIFKDVNGTYTQTQRILAPEPYDSGQFGDTLSLSADGNILAIGEWINTGSVYVYTKDQDDLYQQVQKITTPSPGDAFSYSLLLNSSGDKLIVGADQDTDNGALAGAVYIYNSGSSGFQQVQKLTASGDANPANDRFGQAIAINSSGDILAVGAYDDEENGSGAGSVYIFQSSSVGYQQVEKLLVSGDPNTVGDAFGLALSFNSAGTILAVGNYKDDITGNNDGTVYIFQSSSLGYQQVQKLSASGDDNTAGDLFGSSVSLNSEGDILAVGAQADDKNGNNAGSVYIFQSSSFGYQQIKKLTSQDLDPTGENLGVDVSLNSAGDVLLAAAPFSNAQATYAGAAYIFKYTRDY